MLRKILGGVVLTATFVFFMSVSLSPISLLAIGSGLIGEMGFTLFNRS
jgi:hypothetical protein